AWTQLDQRGSVSLTEEQDRGRRNSYKATRQGSDTCRPGGPAHNALLFSPPALLAAARPGEVATAPIRSMWSRPQSQIARNARLSDRPYSVSEYSTLGGTVA